jgi:hypothetical protein
MKHANKIQLSNEIYNGELYRLIQAGINLRGNLHRDNQEVLDILAKKWDSCFIDYVNKTIKVTKEGC